MWLDRFVAPWSPPLHSGDSHAVRCPAPETFLLLQTLYYRRCPDTPSCSLQPTHKIGRDWRYSPVLQILHHNCTPLYYSMGRESSLGSSTVLRGVSCPTRVTVAPGSYSCPRLGDGRVGEIRMLNSEATVEVLRLYPALHTPGRHIRPSRLSADALDC